MIVYHGTGRDRLEGILREGPRLKHRAYLSGRRAFSTTTDFEIAALFALRRSPPSILKGDESQAGVVLEYDLYSLFGEGRKWVPAVCPGVLQDEREIAVFDVSSLTMLAVWSLKRGKWDRCLLAELAPRR